tara:strand:+ start:578 stop:1180 length:603 start_codon:yes stop_codon:yes gene_type:complete
MKYILGVVILLAFISCGKEDNGNESIFEFNLNNSYRIENTEMGFETPNAYVPQNIPEFNLLLTDSEIGDELTQSCCGSPWDYIINPTTEVQISFAKNKSELSSGIYTYNRNEADNDFVISISNQMMFDFNNNLTSLNGVANSYSSNSEIRIDNAQIELLLGQVILELNYIIETTENKRIVGSYIGKLASFNYNSCITDCD